MIYYTTLYITLDYITLHKIRLYKIGCDKVSSGKCRVRILFFFLSHVSLLYSSSFIPPPIISFIIHLCPYLPSPSLSPFLSFFFPSFTSHFSLLSFSSLLFFPLLLLFSSSSPFSSPSHSSLLPLPLFSSSHVQRMVRRCLSNSAKSLLSLCVWTQSRIFCLNPLLLLPLPLL